MPVRREYVADLYRNVLGREGSEGEIEGHLNNPGGEQGLLDLFNSVAGNKSDGGVNEATVGSTQQQEYQQQYEAGPQDNGTGGSTGGGKVIPDTPVNNSALPPSTPITDQFSGTGTVAPTNYIGRMAGYDANNFADANMQTMKYQVGRLASQYDPADPNALNALFANPTFKAMFPNARITDPRSARVDFGQGQGELDLIENFGAPNARWSWQSGASGASGTGGGTGTGTGGSSPSFRPGSPASTMQNIGQLYGQLGQQYAPPGSPGVMNGPVQQVGQDPLSQLISGGLADLILNQGMTREGQDISASLRDIIASGGRVPGGADTSRARFESARELMAKGERTATNDARAALADRGLLSEPGNASGAEMSTIGRIQTRNAEEFARNLRDIGITADDADNTRLNHALSLATGMAGEQARMLLSTLGAGTDRQVALSQIALQSLSQNMAWNQFLAEFGLKRDQVLYDMESGNIDDIMPYLTMFMQLAQSTARGYV